MISSSCWFLKSSTFAPLFSFFKCNVILLLIVQTSNFLCIWVFINSSGFTNSFIFPSHVFSYHSLNPEKKSLDLIIIHIPCNCLCSLFCNKYPDFIKKNVYMLLCYLMSTFMYVFQVTKKWFFFSLAWRGQN